jgi:putative thioredoxin
MSAQPSPYVVDVTQANFEQDVLVASTQVPVLIDFWAPWCAPCRQLTPVLEKIVDEAGGALILAKINTDTEMQIAQLFGIRSLPTVMLMRDGRPVDGFMGALPESGVREFLATHLGELPPPGAEAIEDEPIIDERTPEEKVTELRAKLAAEPDKDETKLELAQALLESGDVDEVETLLGTLTPANDTGDAAKKLRAQIEFARALKDAPPPRELAAAVQQDPANLRARHQLGTRLLLGGQPADAFEQFLEIMKRDRKFDEDLGRKALVAAFQLVDDPDLVSSTRRKMSAMLF